MENIGLAINIMNSKITKCTTNVFFLRNMSGSDLHACSAGVALVEENISNSNIRFCESGSYLASNARDSMISSCSTCWRFIKNKAINCKFRDCSNRIVEYGNSAFFDDFVENCIVERCFVFTNRDELSGVYYKNRQQQQQKPYDYDCVFMDGSKQQQQRQRINCCFLQGNSSGGFLKDSFVGNIASANFTYRISAEKNGGMQLENNYCIDENQVCHDKNGNNGQSIPEVLVAPRFFENILNWDFENVWRWDDAENRPALRHVGVNAQPPALGEGNCTVISIGKEMEDLLARQVKSNVWL